MKSGRARARHADVYCDRIRVGSIERTRHGAVFEYDAEFLRAPHEDEGIATHLQYARRRFETTGVNLHTYFAGLLPEGLRLRALVKRLKASEDDLLSILVASGDDCIGDVSVVPAGALPGEAAPAVDVGALHEVRFSALFEESLARMGTRSEPTIPGVQDKVSAGMISFPVRARGPGAAFILKLNPPDKPELVQNEDFFMRMARACGVDAATASVVRDRDGEAALLVERFDRVWSEEASAIVRLHQEDACQFLDRYPADKYLIACREIAAGLSVCTAPIVEVARFMRLVAFSYLIANGDLHGKNVSILRSPSGRIALSPAYDVLTTLPYGDRRMALKVDARDDNLKGRSFVDFGMRHGVREKATLAMLDELCERARPFGERLEEIGFDAKRTAELRRVMTKRLGDLSARR